MPFLIANRLNADQKFAEAQKWYHYIFNPTDPVEKMEDPVEEDEVLNNEHSKFWRYLPFRDRGLEKLEEILTDKEAIADAQYCNGYVAGGSRFASGGSAELGICARPGPRVVRYSTGIWRAPFLAMALLVKP